MKIRHMMFWKHRRSREGARIEMEISLLLMVALIVAPARERGLKSATSNQSYTLKRRSREGARIEISSYYYYSA